jgi:hypothetical protein
MAAPTTAARVKKALANPEPSTHGPILPTWAVQQVGSCLRYSGSDANIPGEAAPTLSSHTALRFANLTIAACYRKGARPLDFGGATSNAGASELGSA